MMPARLFRPIFLIPLAFAGCGTTRWTDTTRTATEQILISEAIDEAVAQMDVSHLSGQKIYLDAEFIDDSVQKKYLISSLRNHLLDRGCLLQEKRESADLVVEARAGAVGTDRHEVLFGVPQTNLPSALGATQIPEIPLYKRTNQQGVAKIALFAYRRDTGEQIWQSGELMADVSAKNLWFFGAGPVQTGSHQQTPSFAGEKIPLIPDDTTPALARQSRGIESRTAPPRPLGKQPVDNRPLAPGHSQPSAIRAQNERLQVAPASRR